MQTGVKGYEGTHLIHRLSIMKNICIKGDVYGRELRGDMCPEKDMLGGMYACRVGGDNER